MVSLKTFAFDSHNRCLISFQTFACDSPRLSQAALATIITLACVSVLYATQPYRHSSDNTVVVLGQALVYSWLFVLLLRIVRVGEGGPTIVGCVALVAATVGLLAIALCTVYSDIRKAVANAEDASAAASESKLEDESLDDEALGESRHGGNPPQETDEVELSVMSVEDERLAARDDPKSPWELLGLCAAEPETNGELLTRLDAQSKLMREKDQTIRERDAKIEELAKQLAATRDSTRSK